MSELLLILLPLAAYTGWWFARSNRYPVNDSSQSDDYFRGLDHLLNDDSHNAMITFTELARVNTRPTLRREIEHCITLGNVFRKRGDVDRALQLHQSLLTGIRDNPRQISDDLLAAIHFHLGEDFKAAGVMNRAVTHYQSALDLGTLSTQRDAGKRLIALHRQQKQWQEALDVGTRLDTTAFSDVAKQLAHCHCELAEQSGDDTHLQHAQRTDPKGIRAYAMLAERAMAQAQYIRAIGEYKHIEQHDLKALIAHLPEIKRAFLTLNQEEEWAHYLNDLYQRLPHPNIALLIAAQHSPTDAQAFLQSAHEQHPSFALLAAYLSQTDADTLKMLQSIDTANHALPFTCSQCGFRTSTNVWQCPGCSSLETLYLE